MGDPSRDSEAGKGTGGEEGEAGGSAGSEAQIVAITHSGGWYRLALDAAEMDRSGGAGTQGGKRGGYYGLAKDALSDCALVEHRRFGSKDAW